MKQRRPVVVEGWCVGEAYLQKVVDLNFKL
jgi:hypothetical protein